MFRMVRINYHRTLASGGMEVDKIKHFRKKKSMTQTELAELTGVSVMTIRHYESGEREPRASDIKKLCEVLGVTEDELLNGPRARQCGHESRLKLSPMI